MGGGKEKARRDNREIEIKFIDKFFQTSYKLFTNNWTLISVQDFQLGKQKIIFLNNFDQTEILDDIKSYFYFWIYRWEDQGGKMRELFYYFLYKICLVSGLRCKELFLSLKLNLVLLEEKEGKSVRCKEFLFYSSYIWSNWKKGEWASV